MTKSDKGEREVAWNSDILTPKKVCYHFSFFNVSSCSTLLICDIFLKIKDSFDDKYSYSTLLWINTTSKTSKKRSSKPKISLSLSGWWQGEGGRYKRLVTISDRGGREGLKLPFWRWRHFWMAPMRPKSILSRMREIFLGNRPHKFINGGHHGSKDHFL